MRDPVVEIIEVSQSSTTDCVKGKTSFWDVGFDMSNHNKAWYLLEEDTSRLKGSRLSLVCKDVESLLG